MPTHPHSTLPTTAYPSPLREEEAAAAAAAAAAGGGQRGRRRARYLILMIAVSVLQTLIKLVANYV